MCTVHRVGNAVFIDVTANGKHVDCPVMNYSGVGVVLVGMEPDMWAVRRELTEFPGLLQMVRAHDERIVCLKLSTES